MTHPVIYRMRTWVSLTLDFFFFLQEFLMKEFSVENVYFWVACERYRLTACVDERRKLAELIYNRFLSNDAADPVNVDAFAKNLTPQQLQTADVHLLMNVSDPSLGDARIRSASTQRKTHSLWRRLKNKYST